MESIALAIVLFLAFFSFFCWLVTPTSTKKLQNEVIAQEFEASPQEHFTDLIQPDLKGTELENKSVNETSETLQKEIPDYSLYEKLPTFSIVSLRQIASLLKTKEVIPQDRKLSGKGITKQFLINLIKEFFTHHNEREILFAISEVYHGS